MIYLNSIKRLLTLMIILLKILILKSIFIINTLHAEKIYQMYQYQKYPVMYGKNQNSHYRN